MSECLSIPVASSHFNDIHQMALMSYQHEIARSYFLLARPVGYVLRA